MTTRLILDSGIPSHHPAKWDIEDGLLSLLVGTPGLWRVTVAPSHAGACWAVRVYGPGFDWMTVLGVTNEETGDVCRWLREALRASKGMG